MPQSSGVSRSRVWLFLTLFFLLTTLAGIGYIIYNEVWLKRDPEMIIVRRYPTLFRTKEEQVIFERRYFDLSSRYIPVNRTVYRDPPCRVNCFSEISEFSPTQGKLFSGPVMNHACCQSFVMFQPMDNLTNMFGEVKTVAQFDGYKQFFKIENCSHVPSFNYGQCQQHQDFVTAVTEDENLPDHHDDKYQVDWLMVPGCCKCLNINPELEG